MLAAYAPLKDTSLPNQIRVLISLSPGGNPSYIRARTGLSKSQIGYCIGHLAKQGLVEKFTQRIKPDDLRRYRNVKHTYTGYRLTSEGQQFKDDFIKQLKANSAADCITT